MEGKLVAFCTCHLMDEGQTSWQEAGRVSKHHRSLGLIDVLLHAADTLRFYYLDTSGLCRNR